MCTAVQTLLCEKMIARRQKSQKSRRNRRHSTARDNSCLSIFQCRQFLMKRDMVGRVVQTDVFKGMITVLAGVFKGGRLKNRHTDRSVDTRLRLPGVNQSGFDALG